MHRETRQEKAFHDRLPPEFKTSAQVTFGYQHSSRIIQEHLQTFFDKRADWTQCINAYFQSDKYQRYCHKPQKCEDIPIITPDQLYTMIQEDEDYQADIANFLQLNQTIIAADTGANVDDLSRAAMMLGISPDQETTGLFEWIISRKGLSDEERKDIRHKISSNIQLFSMVISLFSTLFVPGMQLTFPHIGTAMTQQKSRYFYRGENAYYGSSKPSIYRLTDQISPLQKLINQLILDEACFFLDQFDAIQKWQPSTINYLALAQHYGIKTPLLDITSDLKTALFFACCKYENQQWRPLTKKDFANKQASSGAKDSRYGILYRSPTEITDMKWALTRDEITDNLITPIGYQPFMRCSAQHGYMLCTHDETYDLLKDPLFDKFRIEHDEDFCNWIFNEMDCGAKIYPLDDIPKIELYMEKIKNAHVISQTTFDNLVVKRWNYSVEEAQAIKQRLQKQGYTIANGQIEHIHNNKLRKINNQYSLNVAYSKINIPATSRPMIIIPSDTIIEQEDNGEWILAADQSSNTDG